MTYNLIKIFYTSNDFNILVSQLQTNEFAGLLMEHEKFILKQSSSFIILFS